MLWSGENWSGMIWNLLAPCSKFPVRSEYVLNSMKKLLLNVEAWIKNMRIRATFMSQLNTNFECPQVPQHYGIAKCPSAAHFRMCTQQMQSRYCYLLYNVYACY